MSDYEADDYEGLTNLMKNDNIPMGWDVDLPPFDGQFDNTLEEEYEAYGLTEFVEDDPRATEQKNHMKCLEYLAFGEMDKHQRVPMCDQCFPNEEGQPKKEINRDNLIWYTRKSQN